MSPEIPGLISSDRPLLSETNASFRDTTRKWVEENVIAHHRSMAIAREVIPSRTRQSNGELGYFCANLKGYGCAEMSNVEYGLVMQEMSRGGQRNASFSACVGALACIRSTPSAATSRTKYLPGMPKAKSSCFGLTDPGSAHPGACAPAPKKDGNEYYPEWRKSGITSG